MARKHDRRNEPRPDLRPLCPFAGFKPCRGGDCMVWDDDWKLCGMNPGSMYSTVRCAVCDAAVEVIGEYGDRFGDDRR